MFKELDPLLLSQARLSILSLLSQQKEAEFTFIKGKIKITAGNLSIQLSKLRGAGLIEITKQFKGNYPLTICKITPEGLLAFEQFIDSINSYKPTPEL